jgi:hypothetical protein
MSTHPSRQALPQLPLQSLRQPARRLRRQGRSPALVLRSIRPVSAAPLSAEEAAELRKEIVALRKEAATAG